MNGQVNESTFLIIQPCPVSLVVFPLPPFSSASTSPIPALQKSHNQKTESCYLSPHPPRPAPTPPRCYTSNKRRAKEIKKKDRCYKKNGGERMSTVSLVLIFYQTSIFGERRKRRKGTTGWRRKKGLSESRWGGEAGHGLRGPLLPGGQFGRLRRSGEPERERIRAA